FARHEGLHIEELVCAPPSLEDTFVNILDTNDSIREGRT
ncbi:unnamed protein product, partial [marine sediment metagenome]